MEEFHLVPDKIMEWKRKKKCKGFESAALIILTETEFNLTWHFGCHFLNFRKLQLWKNLILSLFIWISSKRVENLIHLSYILIFSWKEENTNFSFILVINE